VTFTNFLFIVNLDDKFINDAKRLQRKLNKIKVKHKIYLWLGEEDIYIYFFLNKENKYLLEEDDISIGIYINEAPKNFKYPADFELFIFDKVPSLSDIEYHLTVNKYNL